MPGDGQGARINFVQRVLRGMPVWNFQINNIRSRNVALQELKIVISNVRLVADEHISVSQARRC